MLGRVLLVGVIGGTIGGSVVSYGGLRYLGKHHHTVFRELYEHSKKKELQ